MNLFANRAPLAPLSGLLPLTLMIACGEPIEATDADTSDTSSSGEASTGEVTTNSDSTSTVDTSTDATDTDDSTDTSDTDSTDTTGDGDGDGDGDWDCDNLPEPVVNQLTGAIAAADMAFDDQGNLVGSDTTAIFKTSAGGQAQLWVPGIEGRAGTRYLSDGRLAFAQQDLSRVMLIGTEGTSEVLASNLNYPFGLVVDMNDMVYIADNNRIVRVDPNSGQSETWFDSPPAGARHLTFDLNYEGMFIGGESSVIYRVPIDGSGNAGSAVEWGTFPTDNGGGGEGGWGEDLALVDGLGVDVCGNLYIAEYYNSNLYKIPAGGGEGQVFVDWNENNYGHGLDWGSGVGGWSTTSIFLPQPYNNHTVIEVELGVPSKTTPFP